MLTASLNCSLPLITACSNCSYNTTKQVNKAAPLKQAGAQIKILCRHQQCRHRAGKGKAVPDHIMEITTRVRYPTRNKNGSHVQKFTFKKEALRMSPEKLLMAKP